VYGLKIGSGGDMMENNTIEVAGLVAVALGILNTWLNVINNIYAIPLSVLGLAALVYVHLKK